MFRTVPLSIIRSFSLYTQQWYMSYRFADSLWAGSGRICVLILLAGFIIRIYHDARSSERQNDVTAAWRSGSWSPWLRCKDGEQASKIKQKCAGEPILTDTVKRVFWKFQQSLGKSIVPAENYKFLGQPRWKCIPSFRVHAYIFF